MLFLNSMRERINLHFGDPNPRSTIHLTIIRELSLKNYLRLSIESSFILSIFIWEMHSILCLTAEKLVQINEIEKLFVCLSLCASQEQQQQNSDSDL